MSDTTETDVEYEYVYEYVEVDATDDEPGAGTSEPAPADRTGALPPRPGVLQHPVRWFTWFRRTRPFWGGLLQLASAYFIGFPIVSGGFAFMTDIGKDAMIPVVLAAGIAVAAVTALVLPKQRHFPAVVAMMLAIASLPLANLGGWFLGLLCGLVGSGLVFAWTPYSDKQLERFAAKADERAARRAAKKGLNADLAVAA